VLAAVGFVALTAVCSLNFNVERLGRGAPAAWDTSLLGRVYGALYGWQDRAIERLLPSRPELRTVGIVAQLGMSTQLALLGICVAAGSPLAFAWIALVELGAVIGLLAVTSSNTEVSLEHH
jgi:hypothetical protein